MSDNAIVTNVRKIGFIGRGDLFAYTRVGSFDDNGKSYSIEAGITIGYLNRHITLHNVDNATFSDKLGIIISELYYARHQINRWVAQPVLCRKEVLTIASDENYPTIKCPRRDVVLEGPLVGSNARMSTTLTYTELGWHLNVCLSDCHRQVVLIIRDKEELNGLIHTVTNFRHEWNTFYQTNREKLTCPQIDA